jgi:hypothetical protein
VGKKGEEAEGGRKKGEVEFVTRTGKRERRERREAGRMKRTKQSRRARL